MRKQPAIETNSAEAATVLSVSPAEEDHALLECIFSHSKWKLRRTHGLASAMAFLQAQRTSVVLCETDLLPGTWRDLLCPDRHREFPSGRRQVVGGGSQPRGLGCAGEAI